MKREFDIYHKSGRNSISSTIKKEEEQEIQLHGENKYIYHPYGRRQIKKRRITHIQKLIEPILYQSPLKNEMAYTYSNSSKARIGEGKHKYNINIHDEDPLRVNKNAIKNKGNFFLSSFYPIELTVDNIVYDSVDDYMNKKKYKKEPDSEHSFLMCIEDWKNIREGYFNYITCKKFLSNPILTQALINTHPYDIIEDSRDEYWGIGSMSENGKWSGSNMAGKILMLVRKTLIRTQVLKLYSPLQCHEIIKNEPIDNDNKKSYTIINSNRNNNLIQDSKNSTNTVVITSN